jgi:bifunctional DNase/RNase
MWRSVGLVGLLLARLAEPAVAGTVEVDVRGMAIDPESGSPVVRLVEKGKAGRQLAIWIGPFEAQAIAMQLRGMPAPRPLTHDLMKALVERLGGRLDRVVIEDMRDNTYFATMHVTTPAGRDLAVDARPSDAIALALRLHGPILVSDEVFAKAVASPGEPVAARLWGLTLQDLTPEIASFFRVPDAHGVLVSDVAAAAPAHDVVRGDVITELDGEPVGSVGELTGRAGMRSSAGPVRLSVRRGTRQLVVSFEAE